MLMNRLFGRIGESGSYQELDVYSGSANYVYTDIDDLICSIDLVAPQNVN
jgi:hypothetical protein